MWESFFSSGLFWSFPGKDTYRNYIDYFPVCFDSTVLFPLLLLYSFNCHEEYFLSSNLRQCMDCMVLGMCLNKTARIYMNLLK